MTFNSIEFILFFIIMFSTYYLLPHKHRWKLMLIGSLFFYMYWKASYISILLIPTVINYFSALYIKKVYDDKDLDELKGKKRAKKILTIGIVSSLATILIFKYFNFFNDSFREIFDMLNMRYMIPSLNFLLPIGISFYTLQTIGYTIDVYKKKIEPERHFGIFLLFVTFFPQLVAGPIERAKNLLPQFRKEVKFNYDDITSGFRLILWGFFKKLVVADKVAVYVNKFYSSPEEYNALSVLIISPLLVFLVYCDFSSYSDIAIGTARVFGFKLVKNFRSPFTAKSFSDFWSRWHISLTTWLKDYVFNSLVSGNKSKLWLYFSLIFTFAVSGLWHGTQWTLVIWGILNGIAIVFGSIKNKFVRRKKYIARIKSRNKKLLGIMNTVVTVGFVSIYGNFFRTESIEKAVRVFKRLIDPDIFSYKTIIISQSKLSFIYILFLFFGVLTIDYMATKIDLTKLLMRRPVWQRWSFYYIGIFLILLFRSFEQATFIYFQF